MSELEAFLYQKGDLTDALLRILSLLDVFCPKCKRRLTFEASPANGSVVLWCPFCNVSVEIAWKGVVKVNEV